MGWLPLPLLQVARRGHDYLLSHDDDDLDADANADDHDADDEDDDDDSKWLHLRSRLRQLRERSPEWNLMVLQFLLDMKKQGMPVEQMVRNRVRKKGDFESVFGTVQGGHPNRYTFKIGGHTELTQDQKTPIAAIKVGTQTNIFNFFGAVH